MFNSTRITLLLILLGILAYAGALHNPYYFDDVFILRHNHWLLEPRPWIWFKSYFADSNYLFPSYRPILMVSFWINEKLGGHEPAVYRAVNLGLHIFNSILVTTLARRLIYNTFPKWGPAWIGLLFLLHPIQTLSINLLWKRSSLLEATWILLALNFRIYRKGWKVPGLICLWLAMFTKESGILLPLYLLCLDIFLTPQFRIRMNKTLVYYLSLLASVLIFIYWRFFYIQSWVKSIAWQGGGKHFLNRSDYFVQSLYVIPQYFLNWLLPAPHILDDPLLQAGFPWQGAILTILLLAISILLSIRLRKDKFFILCMILIWSYIGLTAGPHPLYLIMDQIRLYLPLVGLSYFLVCFVYWIYIRFVRPDSLIGRILNANVALSLILGSYFFHTFMENRNYAYPPYVWRDVISAYPESDLAWSELGVALEDVEDFEGAEEAFSISTRLQPADLRYRVHLYMNQLKNKKDPAPIKVWLKTILTDSSLEFTTPILESLAGLATRLGEDQWGKALLMEILVRNPNYAPAYFQLGQVLENENNLNEAKRMYNLALPRLAEPSLAKEALQRLK